MKKSALLALALPWLLVGCEHLADDFPQLAPIDLSTFGLAADPSEIEAASAKEAAESPVEEVEAYGMKAWLVEDSSLPLVSVQLMFEGAGSSSDPEDRRGRALFAAALLDEGAGDLNALAFQKALDEKAIQMSFRTNDDVLVVQIRSLSEHLPEAFRLLGLALTDARFDRKDIERKRKLALSQLNASQTRPGFVLAKRFGELAFDGHPYGAPPLGDEKALKRMAKSDLENYVTQTLTKERLFIAATGDVTAATLEQLMANHLKDLPDASLLPAPAKTSIKGQGRLEVVKLSTPQSSILLSTQAVDRKDERFFAAFVLNHIVGGDTLTSVLGTAIREKKGLAYSVNSYLDPMSHASSFNVRFSTRNEGVSTAYETLSAELINIAQNGVTEAQYKQAMDYITGSFVLSLDNNSNYTRFLNTMQRFDLGKDYLQTRNDKIRAVTIEQVNALAKDMFDPSRWLVVIVGEPEKLQSGNTNVKTAAAEKPKQETEESPAQHPTKHPAQQPAIIIK